MANRVIYTRPYDAEVEYLESTGTQYIDTEICPDNYVDLEIFITVKSNANSQIFGVLDYSGASVTKQYTLARSSSSSSQKYRLSSKYNNIMDTCDTINTNDVVNILINGKIVSANNTLYNWNFNNNANYNDATFYLFGYHRQFAADTLSTSKIYSFYIKKSGILVRDFIPVRVGQIGYLYDKVSKQLFGNQGTGNFILGADVANPVPNIRRVFRFGNKRFVMPMPYDSRVEYLESTGTQYIDLAYKCSVNTIASVTILPTQDKTQQRFVGSSSAYFEIYQHGSGYYGFTSNDNIHTSTTTFASSTKVNLTTKRKLTINNVISRGIVDNTSTTIYKNAKFGQLYLLTRPSYHPTRAAVCKLYAASVTDGDFKMDLIPVRKNGIGYMYDRVSGKLFGNSGTGQFILGQDINY